MTGYGSASTFFDEKEIRVEIKTINSKLGDMRFRMPQRYGALEVKMRRNILESAYRGKFEVNIISQSESSDDDYEINLPLFRSYYKSISDTLSELNATESNLASGILKIYNVVKANDAAVSSEEEKAIMLCLQEALTTLELFRLDEGRMMELDFRLRCKNILQKIDDLEPFEKQRSIDIRARLMKSFEDLGKNMDIDKNRFEQELVYYFDKLDITEEKVRLIQHCQYFLSQLDHDDAAKGKSLAFISQEMGREINTLGSKANDHQIQHIVVQMKEELEKIKEQLANVV
jgi:uncharacterized protein (TIGR00255 family)